MRGTALVVTEETESLWFEKAKLLGLGDHISLLFRRNLWGIGWEELCVGVARLVVSHGFDLVVIDTFGEFSQVTDENDAAQVRDAMKETAGISDQGAGVILGHHKRKAEGSYGVAVRGSSAFTASVDMIVELERGGRNPRKRVLKLQSRWDDNVGPARLELSMDGLTYQSVDLEGVVAAILPTEAPGLTRGEVREKWPVNGDIPSETTLRHILDGGEKAGLWKKLGGGRKGSAYTYWRP